MCSISVTGASRCKSYLARPWRSLSFRFSFFLLGVLRRRYGLFLERRGWPLFICSARLERVGPLFVRNKCHEVSCSEPLSGWHGLSSRSAHWLMSNSRIAFTSVCRHMTTRFAPPSPQQLQRQFHRRTPFFRRPRRFPCDTTISGCYFAA